MENSPKRTAFERVKDAGFIELYDCIQEALRLFDEDPFQCCRNFRFPLEKALIEAYSIIDVKMTSLMNGERIHLLAELIPKELFGQVYVSSFYTLNTITRDYNHWGQAEKDFKKNASDANKCRLSMSQICTWLRVFKISYPEYVKKYGKPNVQALKMQKQKGIDNVIVKTPDKKTTHYINTVLSAVKKRKEYYDSLRKAASPYYDFVSDEDIAWFDLNLPKIRNNTLAVNDLTPERKEDVFFICIGEPLRRFFNIFGQKHGTIRSTVTTLRKASLDTNPLDTGILFFATKCHLTLSIDEIVHGLDVPKELVPKVSQALGQDDPEEFTMLVAEHYAELDSFIRQLTCIVQVSEMPNAIEGMDPEEFELFQQMLVAKSNKLLYSQIQEVDKDLRQIVSSIFKDELHLFEMIKDITSFWGNHSFEHLYKIDIRWYKMVMLVYRYRFDELPLDPTEKEIIEHILQDPLNNDYKYLCEFSPEIENVIQDIIYRRRVVNKEDFEEWSLDDDFFSLTTKYPIDSGNPDQHFRTKYEIEQLGGKKFTDLINCIYSQGYIESKDKDLLTYVLTGRKKPINYKEEMTVKWIDTGFGYELFYLIKCIIGNEKGKYEKVRRLFSGPQWLGKGDFKDQADCANIEFRKALNALYPNECTIKGHVDTVKESVKHTEWDYLPYNTNKD